MQSLAYLLALIALTSCSKPRESASVWTLRHIRSSEGEIAHRIVPSRAWWDLSPHPETWAELRTSSEGARLVVLSTSSRYLILDRGSQEEEIVVSSATESRRRYRALRLRGGQQWLCSPALTRYVVEQLRSGRSVSLAREGEALCTLREGGFSSCWEALQAQNFGLEAAGPHSFSP